MLDNQMGEGKERGRREMRSGEEMKWGEKEIGRWEAER